MYFRSGPYYVRGFLNAAWSTRVSSRCCHGYSATVSSVFGMLAKFGLVRTKDKRQPPQKKGKFQRAFRFRQQVLDQQNF